jgi:hypothetical protein
MAGLNHKQTAALISVTPRSKGGAAGVLNSIKRRGLAEAGYCQGAAVARDYYHTGHTALMVEYATSTGRISGAAILHFRELSPYKVCKLVATLAERVPLWTELLEHEYLPLIRDAILEA